MTKPHRLIVGPDGRRIAFDIHGDPGGTPVLYLHGAPSSRLEVHVFGLPDAAQQAGVKLVALDRPGIGGTDPKPGRTLVDTADDVAAVADALEHPRFALLAYSAGSPFGLAAATRRPHRITKLGVVSGIAPGDRPELTAGQADEVARLFRWARTRPRRLRAMLHGMRLAVHRPGLLIRSAARGAPAADQAVLARDGAAERFAGFLDAAFQRGVDGVATDLRLAAGPWPFTLDDLTIPVRIWHGEQDRNAPIAAARWLDGQLLDSTLHCGTGDGHASMLADHGSDILAELATP
jgi:pimeloyl-ACP methyl ester carboxylesterase